jgi:phage gpG-like protein
MFSVTADDRALTSLIDKLRGGMPEAWREVAENLHAEVMESFRAQSDPWGNPWRPHSATTLDLRRRGGLFGAKRRRASFNSGAQILKDSGVLMGATVASSTPTGASVEVTGPAARYGRVQHFGNPNNRLPNKASGVRAPIPARPFLPLRPDGRVDLPQVVFDDTIDILRRHLFDDPGA